MKAAGTLRSLFVAAALVLAAFLAPVFVTAQEKGRGDGNKDELEEALAPVTGQWKKNYASPSMGVVLYKARIHQNSNSNVAFNPPDDEREYYVPALEARIFRGINITRRAGFFWGVEAGTTVFVPYRKSFSADVTVTQTIGPPYATYNNIANSGIDTFHVSHYGGTVFLMLKYGYRFELGSSRLGTSAGFQLGTGASLFSGGYDVYAGSKDNPVAKGGYGTHETRLGIATDFSVEAALRLGRNVRLFGAAGLLVTPFEIDSGKRTYIPGSEVLSDPAPTNEEYLKYALNTYDVETDAFGFSMRAGFSLNFN
jgi:hypothetical protein